MPLTSVVVKSRGRQQLPGVFSEIIVASGVEDFGSIASGASESDTMTVPGVAIGDIVMGIGSSISAGGLVVTADITAANTITLRANNLSGGSINLASATFTVVVGKLV